MKNQNGFTLIELLLVLAIIGIISALAIPALVGQRNRARDRSCVNNVVSTLGELVERWDRSSEGGAAVAGRLADMGGVLAAANARGDRNPWDATRPAYRATMGIWAFPLALGEAGYGVNDLAAPATMTGGVTTRLIQATTGVANFTKIVALD